MKIEYYRIGNDEYETSTGLLYRVEKIREGYYKIEKGQRGQPYFRCGFIKANDEDKAVFNYLSSVYKVVDQIPVDPMWEGR